MTEKKSKKSKSVKKDSQKPSLAQMEVRVNEIVSMISQGHNYTSILRYFTDKHNCCDKTVDNYMKRARQRISEVYGAEYRKSLVEQSLIQLDDLYRRNKSNEDLRECRAIIETKNKLLGTVTDKIDITTQGEKIQERPQFLFIEKQLPENE
ncbi:MAG: hypothetical protein FGM14_14130 [Flavobacteriales bacterium]|nr:hypothetical protein [Flavobacteriales bacterium]